MLLKQDQNTNRLYDTMFNPREGTLDITDEVTPMVTLRFNCSTKSRANFCWLLCLIGLFAQENVHGQNQAIPRPIRPGVPGEGGIGGSSYCSIQFNSFQLSAPNTVDTGDGYAQVIATSSTRSGTELPLDLNNNGKQDLVTLKRPSGDISVLFDVTKTGFASEESYDVSDYHFEDSDWLFYLTSAHTIALADLDSDLNPDLVFSAANTYGNSTTGFRDKIVVMRNTGQGQFVLAGMLSLDARPYNQTIANLALADFNADGNVDIVAGTSHQKREFYVFINTGSGSFEPGRRFDASGFATGVPNAYVNVAARVNALKPIDIDGDGKLEMILSSWTYTYDPFLLPRTRSLYVFRNQTTIPANPSFPFYLTAQDNFFPGPNASTLGMATADYNADGKMDFVVLKKDAGAVIPFLNNGDTTFAVQSPAHSGVAVELINSGDFDLNGKPDIALWGRTSNDVVYVLLNQGAANFSPSAYYNTSTLYNPFEMDSNGEYHHQPISINTAVDIDRDGDLDIVLANATTGLTMMENYRRRRVCRSGSDPREGGPAEAM